jgi:hypothetical protein
MLPGACIVAQVPKNGRGERWVWMYELGEAEKSVHFERIVRFRSQYQNGLEIMAVE